ncbi:hypothetical protein C8P63_11941 [Melghirimyces profundicolus]|uniref:Lipoprotein n=1 Tax=Melghirimyces profundicolus TaxID=1242148 RepID=A0A2T6BH00_9BACL|nr:hypothetical protein [Melghirimyces profundicolus]PTX55334.1 hypothetical protein C8P63_11941 [Melghirimyces profundicolus]
MKEPMRYGIKMLLLAALVTGCAGNRLSAPERAAVDFYKEVWVEGDMNHSGRMLQNRQDETDLRWRVAQTADTERKNPPILVTVSPTDSQMASKTILIHRPSDKRDYKVRVQRSPTGWKVVKFEQNYDKTRGGYISNDAYQRYVREYPALTWKRVENP